VAQNKKTMRKILLSAVAIISMSTASMAQSVPNYVPTNGLVGWWPFNGNANDESGNNNNGTVNGATLTTDRFGNIGKAYSFNGTSNRIDLPLNLNGALINLTQFTFSGFINKSSFQNNGGGIFSNWKSGPLVDPFGIIVSTTYGIGGSNCAGTGVGSRDTIQNNSWCHVTVVFDGSQNNAINKMKLYINGQLALRDSGQNVYSNFSIANSLGNTATHTAFGSWYSQFGWIGYFNGKLDDIGIWNRTLSQQEITNLYNANICYDHVTVTDTLIINTNMVGFNPVTYQNTIKVWPNPAHDHITIDNGNIANLNGYQIKISNVLGQQVFQSAINQQQFYINLSTWNSNGTYYINLINPQGVTVETRVIVVQ
jgi:uncharacterized protein YqgQ